MAPRTRGWWREHFDDHPLANDPVRDIEARVNDTGGDKYRCMCKKCFKDYIIEAQAQDVREYELRNRNSLRTRDEIIDDCKPIVFISVCL